MQPFCPLLDFELYQLTFGEGLEAVHLDCGEMDEHILATILLNEAVAFGVIEPLYLPSGHAGCLQQSEPILHKRGAGQTGLACGALYRTARRKCQEKALRYKGIPRQASNLLPGSYWGKRLCLVL